MRFLLSTFLALAALGAMARAQVSTPAKSAESKTGQSAAASATPKPDHKPEAAKTPAATPAPGSAAPKRNLLQRVFGGKGHATPEPKPAATPAPAAATPHPRKPLAHKAESGEEGTKAGVSEEKPDGRKARNEKTGENQPETSGKPAEPEKPKATEKPADASADADSKPATPAPLKKGRRKGATAAEAKSKEAAAGTTPEQAALQQALAGGDPDVIEKAKYNDVKARANEDPHLKELKQKADAAPADEGGRKALKAYNRALFEKMRSMADKDLDDRINSMEKAVMKDLGED